MSRAYKCDRCGKLYEFYKVADKDSNIIHVDGYPKDLCKECANEFKVWFGAEEDKNERSN